MLDREQAGIRVVQVQLPRVDPPSTVIDAFNDVQRARADQERARNEAESYANDILPRARGEAERIKQDAEAYKAQTVNLAQGEAQNFPRSTRATRRRRTSPPGASISKASTRCCANPRSVIVDSSGKGAPMPLSPYLPLARSSRARRERRRQMRRVARSSLRVVAAAALVVAAGEPVRV